MITSELTNLKALFSGDSTDQYHINMNTNNLIIDNQVILSVDALDLTRLLSLQTDILSHIITFLSYDSIFGLLGVSKSCRNMFEPKLPEVYVKFKSSQVSCTSSIYKRSFSDVIVLDAICSDNIIMFDYLGRIGIEPSLNFLIRKIAKRGSLIILKSLPKLPALIGKKLLSYSFCMKAAKHGQLEILKWAYDNKCFPNGLSNTQETSIVFGIAAQYGHLHILKWAYNHLIFHTVYHRICESAARGGHFKILRWARKRKCPWNSSTFANAALGGYVEMLQWLYENGCPWNTNTCTAAAIRGYLEILQWLREKGCSWDKTTLAAAATGGHFKLLQWAINNGCESDENACRNAAGGGYLDILQFLREKGCPWDKETASSAAFNGHLEVFQWAIENGCPLDENTCQGAAIYGYLDILQWARPIYFQSHNIEECNTWDEKVCTYAAEEGQLEILKWMKQNNCYWDPELYIESAQWKHHTNVEQWIREQ